MRKTSPERGTFPCKGSQETDPAASLFLDEAPTIAEELVLMKDSEFLAAVPESPQKERLKALNSQFLHMCSTTYPLLDGETITEHHLSVLTVPYRNATTAALAYVCTTSLAEMVFVAYQVQFDAQTGKAALVYGPTIDGSHPVHGEISLANVHIDTGT
jgi:hypothetical protein